MYKRLLHPICIYFFGLLTVLQSLLQSLKQKVGPGKPNRKTAFIYKDSVRLALSNLLGRLNRAANCPTCTQNSCED